MSRRFVLAVPGDLTTPTGGYAYDRRIAAELARLGWQVDIVDLGDAFPLADVAARSAAQARLAAVPPGRIVVIDGLALGALPEAALALKDTHRLVALVHHPLALETGLAPAEAAALRESERLALSAVRHVVVTGKMTARILAADYAVAAERITVALPGVDRVGCGGAPDLPPPERGTSVAEGDRVAVEIQDKYDPSPALRADPPLSGEGARTADESANTGRLVSLLSVGALVPRKGYDVLLFALAEIVDLPWRLTIVGARDRSPKTAAALDGMIAAHDLGGRVTLAGAVSAPRLAELYREADLFVLASRFEGYGMAFAEAIAHGVPVVATDVGDAAETLASDAGLLVPPGDRAALAAALRRTVGSAAERSRLAAGARAAAARLPTWTAAAETVAAVLEAVA